MKWMPLLELHLRFVAGSAPSNLWLHQDIFSSAAEEVNFADRRNFNLLSRWLHPCFDLGDLFSTNPYSSVNTNEKRCYMGTNFGEPCLAIIVSTVYLAICPNNPRHQWLRSHTYSFASAELFHTPFWTVDDSLEYIHLCHATNHLQIDCRHPWIVCWKLFAVYGLAVDIKYAVMSMELSSGSWERSRDFSVLGTK